MAQIKTSEIAAIIKAVASQYDWKMTGGVASIAAERIVQHIRDQEEHDQREQDKFFGELAEECYADQW